MSNKSAKSLVKIITMLCGFAFISACGVQGDLKPAPPMWGPAKKEYEEKKAKDAQLEKQKVEEDAKQKSN